MPAVALLRGGRIVVASAGLCELTGYTSREMTGPEFRPAQLFLGAVPELGDPPSGEGGASPGVEARLDPLRGPPIDCRVTLCRIDDANEPLLVLFIDTQGVEVRQAIQDVARSLIRAASSELAESIMRLRRAQIGIEALEHAHPEVLAHEMRKAGPIFEEVERIREEVDSLSRLISTARPSPPPFRRT